MKNLPYKQAHRGHLNPSYDLFQSANIKAPLSVQCCQYQGIDTTENREMAKWARLAAGGIGGRSWR